MSQQLVRPESAGAVIWEEIMTGEGAALEPRLATDNICKAPASGPAEEGYPNLWKMSRSDGGLRV